MVHLDERHLRKYLESRLGGSARILAVSVLGQEAGAKELKGAGCGGYSARTGNEKRKRRRAWRAKQYAGVSAETSSLAFGKDSRACDVLVFIESGTRRA